MAGANTKMDLISYHVKKIFHNFPYGHNTCENVNVCVPMCQPGTFTKELGNVV